MKNFFILVLSFCSFILGLSQTGNIQGKVVSNEDIPLHQVKISIEGTSIQTESDSLGTFSIENLNDGQSYKLHFELEGYTSLTKIVIVEGDTILSDVILSSLYKEKELEKVTIIGNTYTRYGNKKSTYVSKLPLSDIENPQVYNTIPQALLKDLVITNFDDALKNAPGLDKLWESTGRGGDGAGYFSLRGFPVQPTMVNGLPSLTNGSPDVQNIENIEVIKGPSGTLYGSSLISYGGLINVTTKKPYAGFGGNISYTAGTYGLNRVTVDVNSPLTAEKDVLLRVNAAYHDENSFQDAGFKKSLFIAPSLVYQASDRLSFNINTEFFSGKSTNQMMLFFDRGTTPLEVRNVKELGYDPFRSYTSNDLYLETPAYSLQGIANYKISDQWTSQTVVSRSSSKSEGYYSYLYELPLESAKLSNGTVFERYMNKQNSETVGTDIQQNFIGDFKIKNMRNRIVVGLDYYNQNIISNSSSYVGNGYIYVGGNDLVNFNQQVAKITNPADYTDDSGTLTQAGVDALLAKDAEIYASKTKQETFSAYVSNVLNILPQLSVMASLRVDRFSNDDYAQTAFSPKFGIVYQPVLDKISLFANYMNGFINQGTINDFSTGVPVYENPKPEHANQLEFGAKLNLLKNKLVATISYYDILVSDKIISLGEGAYTQNGEQRNKGFESSVTANPVSGLDILFGYSYIDSKLIKGDADFVGKRPESSGPANLLNFWINYRFPKGFLPNFGVGFGGNYASENKIFNRSRGTFTLPEYTVISASAFYTLKSFRVTLKLDNITNEEYYKGWSTVSPQKPRIFSANLSYNF